MRRLVWIARFHGDRVVGQSAFEEVGVAAELGGGPILSEFLQSSGLILHRTSSDACYRGVYGCAWLPGSEDRRQFGVTDVIRRTRKGLTT